jgi:hypothetical protein
MARKRPPLNLRSPEEAAKVAGLAANSAADPANTVLLVDGRRISCAGTIDERIQAICNEQRACASRVQLIAARIEPSAIDRRVRKGSLVRVHAGVYALAGAGEVPLGEETGALLAMGPRAALTDFSATVIYAIRHGTARPIHVVVPEGRHGPQPSGVIVHRSLTLLTRDVRIVQGLPVVSPARAMLDSAARLPERQLIVDLDEALHRRIVTLAQIDDVLRRAGRHPGAAKLRATRADRTPNGTASRGQRTLLRLLKQAGVEPPLVDTYVEGWEADLYWPEQKLNVEVDGFGPHTTTSAFEKDRVRDPELRRKGIEVLRFTDRRVDRDGARCVADIVYELGRRAA